MVRDRVSGKKESHRFLTCRSQDGNHWLYKLYYRLWITRGKPFMHEIINRRSALSKEMRVRVCLWVLRQAIPLSAFFCLKKAIFSPFSIGKREKRRRTSKRESTIVMQLRGSYQKRSKQERDFKKPLIAAERDLPPEWISHLRISMGKKGDFPKLEWKRPKQGGCEENYIVEGKPEAKKVQLSTRKRLTFLLAIKGNDMAKPL